MDKTDSFLLHTKGSILEQRPNAGGFRNFVSSHPARVSFCLATILFTGVVTILRPGYGTNDDIQLIAIASGYMGGKPLPFLIYSNVLWGFALTLLYSLNSTVNWEMWLFVMLHFFSAWSLIYLILWHPLKISAKIFGALVIMLSNIYFVLNLTFTTVAAMASAAGLCMLLTAVQSPRMLKQNQFLFGIILTLTGSLIRPESTALVLAILIPGAVICYQFFPIKNLILAFAATGALLMSAYAFNLMYLHQFPDWYYFNAYTTTRRMLHDTPRLVNASEGIRAIRWTTNDLNLFARWFFPDRGVYSLENLRYLVENVSDKRPTFSTRLFLLPRHFLDATVLPYTLLLLLAWTNMPFHGFASRKVLIPSSLFLLTPLAINIYLLWKWKLADYVLLASLESGLIFTLFIGYWYTLNNAKSIPWPGSSNNTHKGLDVSWPFLHTVGKLLFRVGLYFNILLLIGVAGIVAQESTKTTIANINRESIYHQILSDLQLLRLDSGEQKILIISPAFGIPWEWSNPLFIDFPDEPHYLVMGWNTFSPAYYTVLRQYQVESLPGGLYERENIYLMTDEATVNGILKFIKYHEKVNVAARLIYTPKYSTGTVYDESRLYKLEKIP